MTERRLYTIVVVGKPTFHLDADLLGITSNDHARRIAARLLGAPQDAIMAMRDGWDYELRCDGCKTTKRALSLATGGRFLCACCSASQADPPMMCFECLAYHGECEECSEAGHILGADYKLRCVDCDEKQHAE